MGQQQNKSATGGVRSKLPEPGGPSPRRTVHTSFWLDPEPARLLAERAQQLGTTPNLLARQYVLEALVAPAALGALAGGMDILRSELLGLRADVALGVEALLASAGTVNEKQARAWVEASLNRR